MNAPDSKPGVLDASTFEARYTAWVDGQLNVADAAAFELELREQHSLDAVSERESQHALGAALRTHLAPTPLPHGDFFNHQLMERIRADVAASEAATHSPAPALVPWFRSIFARLALTGAAVALVGAVGYRTLISPQMEQRPETAYLTRVVDARSNTPGISAVSIDYKDEGVAVLWLDGMEYLPEGYAQVEEPVEAETAQ